MFCMAKKPAYSTSYLCLQMLNSKLFTVVSTIPVVHVYVKPIHDKRLKIQGIFLVIVVGTCLRGSSFTTGAGGLKNWAKFA